MKMTVIAMSHLLDHLYKNRSNYLMFIGLACIMKYVYNIYGFQTLLLSFGVLLILTSLIIEINKVSTKK